MNTEGLRDIISHQRSITRRTPCLES